MDRRIINDQSADTPDDKRNAVEAAGGTFNQEIPGDYVQGNAKSSPTNAAGETTAKPNYVENLGGKYIDKDGRVHQIVKTPGWFS